MAATIGRETRRKPVGRNKRSALRRRASNKLARGFRTGAAQRPAVQCADGGAMRFAYCALRLHLHPAAQGLLGEPTCAAAPRLLDDAAPALLVCFRLAAGFAAGFVAGGTRLLTGPARLLVTELTGEDERSPTDEREPVPVGLPVTPSGLIAC